MVQGDVLAASEPRTGAGLRQFWNETWSRTPMKNDDAKTEAAGNELRRQSKKPYLAPHLVVHGKISGIARTSPSGAFSDGMGMAANCSGQCQ
jgi:hypothetical protein